MQTLLATYAFAWAAIAAYMLWLARGNARLTRRLERLETLVGRSESNDVLQTKVA